MSYGGAHIFFRCTSTAVVSFFFMNHEQELGRYIHGNLGHQLCMFSSTCVSDSHFVFNNLCVADDFSTKMVYKGRVVLMSRKSLAFEFELEFLNELIFLLKFDSFNK